MQGIAPRPPAWFVRKLRELNPHFIVRWDFSRGRWAIMEAVRDCRHVAYHKGAAVYRLHRRPEPSLFFQGLGSKVLEYVRKNDPRRFRSVQQMVDELKIDTPHPDHKGLASLLT
jgi:hypothetical protein